MFLSYFTFSWIISLKFSAEIISWKKSNPKSYRGNFSPSFSHLFALRPSFQVSPSTFWSWEPTWIQGLNSPPVISPRVRRKFVLEKFYFIFLCDLAPPNVPPQYRPFGPILTRDGTCFGTCDGTWNKKFPPSFLGQSCCFFFLSRKPFLFDHDNSVFFSWAVTFLWVFGFFFEKSENFPVWIMFSVLTFLMPPSNHSFWRRFWIIFFQTNPFQRHHCLGPQQGERLQTPFEHHFWFLNHLWMPTYFGSVCVQWSAIPTNYLGFP